MILSILVFFFWVNDRNDIKSINKHSIILFEVKPLSQTIISRGLIILDLISFSTNEMSNWSHEVNFCKF